MTGERLEVAGCVHLLGGSALKVSGEVQQSLGFLGDPVGKESACNAGDPGSIPGRGKIPQRGDWRAPVRGVAKESDTEQLVLFFP